MRFAVDEMLGKLARWMRAMGLDVEHHRPFHDAILLETGIEQSRIVLTRDHKLAARKPPPTIWLIEDDIPFNQMVEVVKKSGIDPRAKAFSRCTLCNEPLAEITREEATGRVPPFVFATQVEYRYCGKCDKIYWPGSHRGRMETVLDEVAAAAII